MNTDTTIESFGNILKPFLVSTGFNNKKIVMDNARCHVSEKMLAWIKESGLKFVEPGGKPHNCIGGFPPNSPDLNPIEFVWNITEQNLQSNAYTNVVEFMNHIQSEWNKISIQNIRE